MKKVLASFLLIVLAFTYNVRAKEINLLNFKAKYRIDFSGFVAGVGELDAAKDNSTYSIKFTGNTVSPVKWFFNLRVSIQDAINIKNDRDIYYKSYIIRPKKVKVVLVKFYNKTRAEVVYKKNSDKQTYILKSKNGLFSPLSIYLFFLTNKIKIGKSYFRDIVISKKIYRVKITPLGKETINLDIFKRKKGKRKTLKTELLFYKLNKDGSVIKKKEVKRLIAWISLNPPQIPLLIQMWHFIGVFQMKLVKLKIY